MFCKKVFLEILQNSHENTCVGVSFLNLFRMDFFGAAQAWGGDQKAPAPPYNLSHISCNDETWHSYTSSKDDRKNV